MVDSCALIEKYLKGFYAGDATVRELLADDFHFSGPAAHIHGADAFLRASGHAAAGTKSIEIEKLFVSGDDIAAFYIIHLDHRVSQIHVAEHFHVVGPRIVASRLIMDTAPFLNRASREAIRMAIDPVCHMDVDATASAASRVHQGVTYYFCSLGCAEAFSRDPTRYLS